MELNTEWDIHKIQHVDKQPLTIYCYSYAADISSPVQENSGGVP